MEWQRNISFAISVAGLDNCPCGTTRARALILLIAPSLFVAQEKELVSVPNVTMPTMHPNKAPESTFDT